MSVPWRVVMKGRRRPGASICCASMRRNGMRDGVVDVQQIQLVGLRHFGHARRQREAIGRILKKRIGGDFHLVVVDARDIRIEPDGIGVTDEVDLVAASGQFEAQFRGDNAAAAVGGIAGDTDFHFCSVALTGRSVAYPI